MNLSRLRSFQYLLAILILLILVGSRIWIETPNFKPVAAICLWSALWFQRWTWAIMVPLLGMALSDLWLGASPMEIAVPVYLSLGLTVCLGRWAGTLIVDHERKLSERLTRLLTLSLASGLLFFVITNFSVWAWSGWYELTWSDLQQCFVQALPFYRWTVASDLMFGFVPAAVGLVLMRIWGIEMNAATKRRVW